MKVTHGLIIFFLSLIAMVAEFIVYMIFAMALGTAQPSQSPQLTGTYVNSLAGFFVWLMFMSGMAGGAALLSGCIGSLAENSQTGTKAFMILAGLGGAGVTGLMILSRVL
jgi:hypothetical protein